MAGCKILLQSCTCRQQQQAVGTSEDSKHHEESGMGHLPIINTYNTCQVVASWTSKEPQSHHHRRCSRRCRLRSKHGCKKENILAHLCSYRWGASDRIVYKEQHRGCQIVFALNITLSCLNPNHQHQLSQSDGLLAVETIVRIRREPRTSIRRQCLQSMNDWSVTTMSLIVTWNSKPAVSVAHKDTALNISTLNDMSSLTITHLTDKRESNRRQIYLANRLQRQDCTHASARRCHENDNFEIRKLRKNLLDQ